MRYEAVNTDDGIEIRDDGNVIATFNTWPPREDEGLEQLFEDANISTPQKGLFKILFGVSELEDERTESKNNTEIN